MEGIERFSTHLLDRALAKERERREQRRQERLTAVFKALDKLSNQIPFEEAYIFGSLTKPYHYFDDSDVDIAFVGLGDEVFFRAIAFLSRELNAAVDVLQLESHPLREKIIREGIRWKKSG
jgi:predicted nucleotidyltransferase